MVEEAIDYGKVTGMVHSTESFGAVDGPGPALPSSAWPYALSILPQSRYLGDGD